MRLWHQRLIPILPRQQLLGQHRECCALRGKGWGRKHATVDYVFTHDPALLIAYHWLVLDEMRHRGYTYTPEWDRAEFRGKQLGVDTRWYDLHTLLLTPHQHSPILKARSIYPEHDDAYLKECLDNLKRKGVFLNVVH